MLSQAYGKEEGRAGERQRSMQRPPPCSLLFRHKYKKQHKLQSNDLNMKIPKKYLNYLDFDFVVTGYSSILENSIIFDNQIIFV
jgi:hypothetical protein